MKNELETILIAAAFGFAAPAALVAQPGTLDPNRAGEQGPQGGGEADDASQQADEAQQRAEDAAEDAGERRDPVEDLGATELDAEQESEDAVEDAQEQGFDAEPPYDTYDETGEGTEYDFDWAPTP